ASADLPDAVGPTITTRGVSEFVALIETEYANRAPEGCQAQRQPAKCCRLLVGAKASLLAQNLGRQIVKVNCPEFDKWARKGRGQRLKRIRSPNRRNCGTIQRFLRRRTDENRIARRDAPILHDL